MVTGPQSMEELDRLDISPNLVKAYLSDLTKTCLMICAISAGIYLGIYLAGEEVLTDMLARIGVPFVWLTWAAMVALGVLFVLTIFKTLQLTSYELLFEGKTLKYSYGNFVKVTKEADMTTTISVNYKEYSPFKLGELIVTFTDAGQPALRVQYVDDAKYQCDMVNKLINLRRAQQVQKIEETGVVG